MLSKSDGQGQMFQYIQLEDLVPQDHLLRRIRAVLDLKAIYAATEGCYSANRGRPSVDPTVAFRMMLLGYLFNLPERRLCEDLQMHAGYRWFCGLDFNQKVPDRTTLVKLRRHQWGEAVFREVMRAGVQQCIDAGLVKGSAVVVDGSEVRARAAIKSLEAVAPEQSVDEFVDKVVREDSAEATPQGPADPKEPPSSGSSAAEPAASEPRKAGDENFHGEKFTNETHRSKTDPDARLFRKGNTGATLSYLVHNAMDLKSGVILATTASHAYSAQERTAAIDMLDEIQGQFGQELLLRFLLMDANYTEARFLAQVLSRGVEPIVPTDRVAKSPVPGPLRRRLIPLETGRTHRDKVHAAEAARHVRGRERPPELARARTRIERTWAEAKECHGMRRAKGLGLEMMNIQALMTATVQNLRRLASVPRNEGSGQAAVRVGGAHLLTALNSAAAALHHVLNSLFRSPWSRLNLFTIPGFSPVF